VTFPFVTVNAMTAYGSPWGAMTAPAIPFTSAGTTYGWSFEYVVVCAATASAP
jgi:hypothetical protein